MQDSPYHIELYEPDGTALGDLVGRARNIHVIQSRNNPEEISFDIDVNEFERYAELIHVESDRLIIPGHTEVRIKRKGGYLCGGKIVYMTPRISSSVQVYTVRAVGFLTLLMDRFTNKTDEPSRSFVGTPIGSIFSTLITEAQTGTNRDFGITIGSIDTLASIDKSFDAMRVSDAIKDGSETYGFDFYFTPDKKFYLLAKLGKTRPDIVFDYPGNINEIPEAPVDATNLKNRIYAQGSGSGTEGNKKAQSNDVNSQLNYVVREDQINHSDVQSIGELQAYGDAELAKWGNPVRTAVIVTDGSEQPAVTSWVVGDFLKTRTMYRSMNWFNGFMRADKRDIFYDERGVETVTISLSR